MGAAYAKDGREEDGKRSKGMRRHAVLYDLQKYYC